MKGETMAWVYILLCSDGTYYTGSTVDLQRRLWEHAQGIGCRYTKKRRPVKLVFAQEVETRHEAMTLEKQVKGWSHAKKEALVRDDMEALVRLARGRKRAP